MKEAIKFLKKIDIDKSKFIVVACSGGIDSMALLNLLYENGYKIVCAHVNHNLRKESKDEYTFVESYCKDKKILFEGMKIENYSNNKFTEAEARKKRYNFFEKILKKYDAKYLFTAHHGDDLIETIIMRLIRGSNLKGYRGFSKISTFNDFKIIRPLIFYTKEEIENYVKANKISFVQDLSNFSKKYMRNRIRLDILPILKNENKKVNLKFLDYNNELERAYNFIKEEVDLNLKDNYDENNKELNLCKFKKLNEYIKEKELEEIMNNLYADNLMLVNKKHIESLISLINTNGCKKLYFPNSIIVEKEYNKIKFITCLSTINNDYSYILKDSIEIPNFGSISVIEDINEKSNYVIKLDSSKVKLPLVVRNKKSKDFMRIKNLGGQKSLKKIFIDEKISRDLRNIWPVVTDSENNILWIPGIKKSEFDCCNKDFYDIILKYTKRR